MPKFTESFKCLAVIFYTPVQGIKKFSKADQGLCAPRSRPGRGFVGFAPSTQAPSGAKELIERLTVGRL